VCDTLQIASHKGNYAVSFDAAALKNIGGTRLEGCHFIIDETVSRLYADDLGSVLSAHSVLLVEATETSKCLDRFSGYVEHLVSKNVRRGHGLVAIGGGIVQDITCFLAATLLRGLVWYYYPTTLLSQADSCIGSKSSINVGNTKNILGTFTPPSGVSITTRVLRTLTVDDVRSGIGEMLKVHAIEGPKAFDRIAEDYSALTRDEQVLVHYIHESLRIKKFYIEMDEFDKGPRNVLNYGHTFGHALESATGYGVPHGIAVTIGMDMANFIAVRLNRTTRSHYERMRGVLKENAKSFLGVEIPPDAFFTALLKDKKHMDKTLKLVLPDANGVIGVALCDDDARFREACAEYITSERHR
jgi:3-dehydroquinate synthase